jgi:hypothetical protein
MINVIHLLLTFAVPFLCGVVAGCLGSGARRGWALHVAFCLVAIAASILLGYAGFVVFSGAMTGQWPKEFPLAGIAYALAWFAMVAVFTSVPTTVAGYVIGALCRQPITQR